MAITAADSQASHQASMQQMSQQLLRPIQQAADAPDTQAMNQRQRVAISQALSSIPLARVEGALPAPGQSAQDPRRPETDPAAPRSGRSFRMPPSQQEQLRENWQATPSTRSQNTNAQRSSQTNRQNSEQMSPRTTENQSRNAQDAQPNASDSYQITHAAIQAQGNARELVMNVNQALSSSTQHVHQRLLQHALLAEGHQPNSQETTND
ncbi:hypothetical protein [Celerinatantimonas sp. YJH-8]|uniref:hypothetical protein n=1 Tax=Celerinatantimonas sp. YJH-8 TaxID=3228714 RepID=UPI0038C43048